MRICFNNGVEKRYENVTHETRFAKALLSRRLNTAYPVLKYSDKVAEEMCRTSMRKAYVVGISDYPVNDDRHKEFSSVQEIERYFQTLRYLDYHKAYFFEATLCRHYVELKPIEEIEVCK